MSKHLSHIDIFKQDDEQILRLISVINRALPADLLKDYLDDMPKLHYYYALMFCHGYLYIKQNKDEARLRLLWSACQNYAPSQYKLGELCQEEFLSENNQLKMNDEVYWWEKAAAQQPTSSARNSPCQAKFMDYPLHRQKCF